VNYVKFVNLSIKYLPAVVIEFLIISRNTSKNFFG